MQERRDEKSAQAQKMQAIGQLAGGIAHDFSNLLTAIIGSCDLLLQNETLKRTDGDEVEEIRRNSKRAAALAQQLLAFSRQQSLQPQEVSLVDVLADLGNLLRHLLGEKTTLRVRCQDNLWLVRVDINQFEQVVVNLAVNARDAMPNGGSVAIDAENIRIAVRDDVLPVGEYVLCKVTDTGSGISHENMQRIFEPFFSTKERGRGVGLGLATVLGIVRQSGGFILPESTPGQGSVFRVYLPRFVADDSANINANASADFENTEIPVAEPSTPKQSRHILVVEDEEGVRRFAVRALQRRGFLVSQAASAEEALQLLKKNPDAEKIALLLSDVIMSGIDGPQLAMQLRETYPDIRVLFMSGYGSGKFRDALESGNVVDFLAKPFSLKQLITRVEQVLETS